MAPWVAAAVSLAALALTSCSDGGNPLPGGYFISVASSSEKFLTEPKHGGSILGLGTDLEEVGNQGEFIFGRSGAARGFTPGYFLLNSTNGVLQAGLNRSNWLSLTTSSGISNPPTLVPPERKGPLRR